MNSTTTTTTALIGRIISIPGNDGYAFIGINSVANSDGTQHDLDTTADIFLHKDDFSGVLEVGKKVAFTARPDTKRGEGYYRAFDAMQHVDEMQLVPADEPPMAGFNAVAPFGGGQTADLAILPTPRQLAGLKKPLDASIAEVVLKNSPAPGVPRDSSVPPNMEELMREFLKHLFPGLEQFGTHFGLDSDEAELAAQMEQARAAHADLGMHVQLTVLETEFDSFMKFREALRFMVQEHLVRRDTIIPIQNLPDFFCAVPVWYLWLDQAATGEADRNATEDDPHVHPATQYFCNLFPNQNWADVFQMFNRRVRGLKHYKGDIIPPSVSRRILETRHLFDYIAIMTPYHDVAGRDWNDTEWLRLIDPYVVGFKKGIPYFFILARFSDSGTFPLFNDMIGDTMKFLRKNRDGLEGFNTINNPFWHFAGSENHTCFDNFPNKREARLGSHLQVVQDEMQAAFEAGRLFDWLRGQVTAK